MKRCRFDEDRQGGEVNFTVICDTREQKWAHVQKHFDDNGVRWLRSKLPIGDFGRLDNLSVVVDRKASLTEVEGNLIQQHDRFRREAQRAQENGIRLIVLIEEENVREMADVSSWQNPRRERWERMNRLHARGEQLHVQISSKPPVTGTQLKQIMTTMADKYGIEWRFCPKAKVGETILAILAGGA